MKYKLIQLFGILVMVNASVSADFLVVRIEPKDSATAATLSASKKYTALTLLEGQEPDFINPPTEHISDLETLYNPHTTLVWDIKTNDKHQLHCNGDDEVMHLTLNNQSKPMLFGQFLQSKKYWSQFDVQLKPRHHFLIAHRNYKLHIDYMSNLNASFDQPAAS